MPCWAGHPLWPCHCGIRPGPRHPPVFLGDRFVYISTNAGSFSLPTASLWGPVSTCTCAQSCQADIVPSLFALLHVPSALWLLWAVVRARLRDCGRCSLTSALCGWRLLCISEISPLSLPKVLTLKLSVISLWEFALKCCFGVPPEKQQLCN